MQKQDLELLKNTEFLVKKEKEFTVQILRNLREIERKKLFVELNYSSLHGYCVEALGYSSSEAFLRISAMRVMKEIAGVEEKIKSGALSLTVVGEMQMLVKKKEKSEEVKISKEVKINLLKELEGKSTRTAQKIVKEKLQIEDKVSVSDFKFKDSTMEKFKKLSKKMDVENLDDLLLLVIKMAEDKLVEEKQEVQENSPALEKSESERKFSRYIPLKIKRQVYIKANYQCERCKSRKYLNIDHIRAFSLGGQHSLANLRVLCSPCNQRERVKLSENCSNWSV